MECIPPERTACVNVLGEAKSGWEGREEVESGAGKEGACQEELREDQCGWSLVTKEMRLKLKTGIWILVTVSDWDPWEGFMQ